MARPKKHESAAARQAAHRQRAKEQWIEVDRASYDALVARLESLQQAVSHAAVAGDALAQQCRAGSIDTVLDNLIVTFEQRATPTG